MRIDKKKILRELKGDLEASKQLRKELDSKIEQWKDEYNGKPYGNEREGKSKIVSRDIKKQYEWGHSALIEPFVSTPDIVKADPVTFEDEPKASMCELTLNTQFCRQFHRFNFLTKALKVLAQEGTLITRTGWEYEEDIVEVEEIQQQPNPQVEELKQVAMANQGNPEVLQQIAMQIQQLPLYVEVPVLVDKVVPIKDKPTAMICRNEDVFIDPTCQDDMDKCQFVIHRYETDMNTLKQNGRYKNLDKIFKQEDDDSLAQDGDYVNPDKTEFKFRDKARKKLLVYEYWGYYDVDEDGRTEPIVCAWVEDTIIRLEENPFPDKKVPFIVTPFHSVPFELYGETDGEVLSDVQKIKTAIYRGFIDNMALSNNGQKGIRRGALDYQNKKRFLEGENFEFNGQPTDFYDGNFNELPNSVFNILQLMNNEAESITGIASFNQGLNGNSLGETATAVRGVLDSASSRRLNTVRSISENLIKPLLRKWLAYDAEFLNEETQFRLTNGEFVRLRKDDLGAKIDIDLSISTSDDNRAKASELTFLLQTIGPNEDPNMRKILMSKIARLYRMPELAHEIETYKPEPDPMQQRVQELQIALLEAQVANERAKANENEIDSAYKQARTQTELAKADNMKSKTDTQDLDYIQKFHRTDEKAKAREVEQKQNYELNKEKLKLLQNSKALNL